jgi:S1 RNA binding domain protein
MDYEIGGIYEGTITGITQFGVFVELKRPDAEESKKNLSKVTGMVHISEVAEGYVKDINEFIKVGEAVKVKYIGVNEKNKVALSMRQVNLKPRETAPPAQNFEDMLKKFTKNNEEKLGEYRRRAEGGSNRKKR